MDILHSSGAMQRKALEWRCSGKRVAFVPTMGFLHEGHLSLMRIARRHADIVVASIFVNPTQFGPNEDFDHYPRDLQQDEDLCRQEHVDVVFCPEIQSMYDADASVSVSEDRLSKGLCGAARPEHFSGVLTIVAKLFNIVLPDVAVFGEKDAQQLRLIRRMVRDLNFPVRILSGPIIRESDGLAKSSRNSNLPPEAREQAPTLHRSLKAAATAVEKGERDVAILRALIEEQLNAAPLGVLDYLAFVDDETLEPVDVLDATTLCALAVQFPGARLIDNYVLLG